MFADAIDKARDFTKPLVISHRRQDGACGAAVGGYVVINRDGWAVSAYHIFEEWEKVRAAARTFTKAEADRAAIYGAAIDKKERARRLKTLPAFTNSSTTHASLWLGLPGTCSVKDTVFLVAADLAIFRIDGFDHKWVTHYPELKDPSKGVRHGTSLCRYGFPFHSIDPTWNGSSFHLPKESVPIPAFPSEGMFSRDVNIIIDGPAMEEVTFPLKMIETSSPGLRGQSGGPIFDRHGQVWGVQSRTIHYPLGFNPPVPGGKKGEVEHQFMNAGWGTHPETLVGALRDRGVNFQLGAA